MDTAVLCMQPTNEFQIMHVDVHLESFMRAFEGLLVVKVTKFALRHTPARIKLLIDLPPRPPSTENRCPVKP